MAMMLSCGDALVDFLPVTAVAEAVVWLASDRAAYITGAALPVDAGEMLV